MSVNRFFNRNRTDILNKRREIVKKWCLTVCLTDKSKRNSNSIEKISYNFWEFLFCKRNSLIFLWLFFLNLIVHSMEDEIQHLFLSLKLYSRDEFHFPKAADISRRINVCGQLLLLSFVLMSRHKEDTFVWTVKRHQYKNRKKTMWRFFYFVVQIQSTWGF